MAKNTKPTKTDIYLNEYENVVKQFIHWDVHFWQKHQFFFAIEAAFILGGSKLLLDELAKPISQVGPRSSAEMLFLALCMAILNFFLCFVWLKTSLRSRMYIDSRIERAKELEKLIKPAVMATFSSTQMLNLEKQKASRWENTMPKAFMGVWLLLILYFICLLKKALWF